MPVPTLTPHPGAALDPLVRLTDATRSRDLRASTMVALDDAGRRFVRGLAAEMLAFRAVARAASQSVAHNTEQLGRVTASAREQRALLDSAATAIVEIDRGAANVAGAAADLQATAAAVRSSTENYESGIDGVDASLGRLIAEIALADEPVAVMAAGDAGILAFLDTLLRIARQARLLGINAAIEAAYLGAIGSGFAIVATEIKALATSTVSSAETVKGIERRLNAASTSGVRAIAEASAAARAVKADLDSARAFARTTQAQVATLDGTIVEVAAAAGAQSAALATIVELVERVASGARTVADAAERASALDLDGMTAALAASIDRYALDDADADAPAYEIALLPAHLHAAATELRAQVDADQRAILALVVKIAVAVGRNGYEWQAIAAALTSLRADLDRIVGSLDDATDDAGLAGEGARRLRDALSTIGSGYGAAIAELGATLERVAGVRRAVEHAEAAAGEAVDAGLQAGDILAIVDTISGDTNLLAVNAAIEAAHAGTAGGGFGVIADEIGRLATMTGSSVRRIAALVASVVEASRSVRVATADAAATTTATHDTASVMRATIGTLHGELDATLTRATEVAGVVQEQRTTLAHARDLMESARAYVDADRATATDERRLELAELGTRAHALAARRPLGTNAERLRTFVNAAAAQMDAVFDEAIASGAIRLEDCWPDTYEPIVGPRIAELGRLFDVSRVPAEGFVPAKYATRFDRAVEGGFNAIIDRLVPLEPLVTALVAVDLNGFCFGHYRACRQDWTGAYVTDLATNRIKRFFDDTLSIRCARVGLGAAAQTLPQRATLAQFRSADAVLERGAERPWGIFTFARDTGSVYNDLSVGLFAQGRRVATIRCLYDADVL
jgi:methyl-accepting chemotaxis protein